jgi:flagellar biosynthesis GTPase FlhF
MQISKLFLVVCAAALCLAPLTIRATENEAQTQPPATKPQETTASKAELKKQAAADAKAAKEAEKKAKAEAEANRKAEQAEQVILKKHAEAQAKAAKEAEKKAQQTASTQSETKKKSKQTTPEQANAKPKVEKKALAFKPIEAPPLPISADKQQRLAELLRKYKVDELTPEQYHQERAKILAEP